ncbi:alpha/beta hydrolase, partial [bacterium]|nr:alpha/beta hydrolase [bacterium]
PEATLSEIVDEAASAVRYVVDHATELGCDPNRIFVGGHSAGAHLAAALVTDIVPANVRESVAGLLLIGGAFDLRPISERSPFAHQTTAHSLVALLALRSH